MAQADGTTNIRQSLSEYGRGIAGGLLFSLPLFFTEEVWTIGIIRSEIELLLALLFTFMLLLGYNRYAGLREDASFTEVVIDSVEELGLGIFLSILFLWLLGRINSGMGLRETVGMVLVEAMAAAVGVSVGTAQLGEQSGDHDQGMAEKKQPARNKLWESIVLSVCGSFLIVANIAATMEVPLIGSSTDPWNLLIIAILSISLGAVVLHFSGFRGSGRKNTEHPFQVLGGVMLAYLIALTVSAWILWFSGRFDGVPVEIALAYTITAGLPAVLGASAGRLLLKA